MLACMPRPAEEDPRWPPTNSRSTTWPVSRWSPPAVTNEDLPKGDQESPAFMSALVTEHFALQSVSSATISESSSRAALYLSALSSGLVAIGFASSHRRTLEALAFTVLPTVFVLGWFTVVRLIDTSVQNIVSRRRIETIRQYYAEIDPRRAGFFESDAVALGVLGVRYSGRSILFTMASMILVVNAVVAGATATLLCVLGAGLTAFGALPVGGVAAVVTLAWGLLYQSRRLAPLISREAATVGDVLQA
jgi:hypothetical protein